MSSSGTYVVKRASSQALEPCQCRRIYRNLTVPSAIVPSFSDSSAKRVRAPHSQPCVSVSPYWWCDTGKLSRQKVTDGTETRPLAISSRDPRDVQAEQVRRAGEE